MKIIPNILIINCSVQKKKRIFVVSSWPICHHYYEPVGPSRLKLVFMVVTLAHTHTTHNSFSMTQIYINFLFFTVSVKVV